MVKIAFCFLLYDEIQHDCIWRSFFKGNESRYSIYSHPKKITKRTPNWIKKSAVKRVSTTWCDESLVFAFIAMLREALKKKSNKYFYLVSGTDLPLHDFDYVYKRITSSSKSTIHFNKSTPRKPAFLKEYDIYTAYQWLYLNRKCATDLIRLRNFKDTAARSFLKNIRQRFKNARKEGRWIEWCEDEIYPIMWFIHLYGKPSSTKFKSQIKKGLPTFAKFKSGLSHPIIWNKKLLTGKGRWLSKMSRTSLIARKFTDDGAYFVFCKNNVSGEINI